MKGKSRNGGTNNEEQDKLYNLYFKETEGDMNEEERELFQYIVDTFGPLPPNEEEDPETTETTE